MFYSDSTSIVDEILNDLNMNFNNNDEEFLSLAYWCQDNAAVIRKFDGNNTSIISLEKACFHINVVYQKQATSLDECCGLFK